MKLVPTQTNTYWLYIYVDGYNGLIDVLYIRLRCSHLQVSSNSLSSTNITSQPHCLLPSFFLKYTRLFFFDTQGLPFFFSKKKIHSRCTIFTRHIVLLFYIPLSLNSLDIKRLSHSIPPPSNCHTTQPSHNRHHNGPRRLQRSQQQPPNTTIIGLSLHAPRTRRIQRTPA